MRRYNKIKFKFPLIVVLLITSTSFSQNPNWDFDEHQYEHFMTLVAFSNINGSMVADANDKVAAFINGEVRGVAYFLYNETLDRYYADLAIFSNSNGDNITFKVYDDSEDSIIDIETTLTFEVNAHIGNLNQAYSISYPALKNDAELLDIGLENVEVNGFNINEGEVILYVNSGENLEDLTINFSLSEGASMIRESLIVTSGNNNFNFTQPVQVAVRSEDESVLNEFNIEVRYSAITGGVNFYKKDAVCYKGGEIKVEANANGLEVKLIKDTSVLATGVVVNGKVLFTNLNEGNYTVEIEGIQKNVEIILKE